MPLDAVTPSVDKMPSLTGFVTEPLLDDIGSRLERLFPREVVRRCPLEIIPRPPAVVARPRSDPIFVDRKTGRPLPRINRGQDAGFEVDFAVTRAGGRFALIEVEVGGRAPIYNAAKVMLWHSLEMPGRPLLFIHVLTRIPRNDHADQLQRTLLEAFASAASPGGFRLPELVYRPVFPERLDRGRSRLIRDADGRLTNHDALGQRVGVSEIGRRISEEIKAEIDAFKPRGPAR